MKHRVFQFLDADILPDNKLVNIAIADAYALGVLSSRTHVLWSLAAGSRLGVGNDSVYVKTTCFETFPFPAASPEQQASIRALAERLDAHRKRQQAQHSELTLTGMYNVLEKLRAGEALTAKEKTLHEQGLVSVLRELHDELDRAVFAAYGWSDLADTLVGLPGATTPLPNKPEAQTEAEDELLRRLVALNSERAAEETRGHIRWLRPEYQNPTAATTPSQQHADFDDSNDNPSAPETTAKTAWPKLMREQVAVVRQTLQAGPQSIEQLASRFKRNPSVALRSVLEALEEMGLVQCEDQLFRLMR